MSKNKDKIFFIHLRPLDGDIAYLLQGSAHAAASKGGFTVAYKYDDDGVVYGVARVSPKDAYVKSVGREVSTKKLEDNAGYWPGEVADFRDAIVTGLRTTQRRRYGKGRSSGFAH